MLAQTIDKYLAAEELEMVIKSNLGSFYSFVNNKLNCTHKSNQLNEPSVHLLTNHLNKQIPFTIFTTDNGSDAEIERRNRVIYLMFVLCPLMYL